MADKIYQTEGAIKMAASVTPKSGGYFLIKAEDIQVAEGKSLADYIGNGGGGGGSNSMEIPIIHTDLTWDSTVQELLSVIRENGITKDDTCIITNSNLSITVMVKIDDYNASVATHIPMWYDFTNPLGVRGLYATSLSLTIRELNQQYVSGLDTVAKDVVNAINELNTKIENPNGDPTTVWYINDNPDLSTLPFVYQYTIPISFTSNGTLYAGIGKNETGSSSWGIHTLTYVLGGYSNNVYTNNPSGSYGIAHGWKDEAYRTITIHEPIYNATLYAWLLANATLMSGEVSIPFQPIMDENLETEDKTVVGAINEVNEKVNNSSGGSLEMPTIRFVGLKDNVLLYKTPDGTSYPLRFSIEIVSGSLQVGDTLQICGVRTFGESKANPYKKRKLRRFAEREIYVDDLDQRYLMITVDPTKNAFAHLSHNNCVGSGGPVTVYFRVRRPEGQLQANDSGMTVSAKFSNVVPVSIMYKHRYQEHPDGGEYEVLKINVL